MNSTEQLQTFRHYLAQLYSQIFDGEDFTTIAPKELMTLLIDSLSHPDFHLEAIAALALMGEACIEPLKELYHHRQPQVRINALLALGKIGAVSAIADSLHDHNTDVKSTAIMVLLKIGTLDAVKSLIKGIESEAHWIQAVHAFVLPGETVIAGLIEALTESNIQIKKYAILALGELRTLEAIEPLLALLTDEYLTAVAITAIVKICEVSIHSLTRYLSTDNRQLKIKVLLVLGTIADPESKEALEACLGEDEEINLAVSVALERIQHQSQS